MQTKDQVVTKFHRSNSDTIRQNHPQTSVDSYSYASTVRFAGDALLEQFIGGGEQPAGGGDAARVFSLASFEPIGICGGTHSNKKKKPKHVKKLT